MRTALAPTLRRFWRAWLALACSAALGAVVLTIGYFALEAVWPSGEDDLPPLIAVLLVGSALWRVLLVGLVLVPFRHLVAQPRFPFLRWGYLVVAALPFLYALVSPDAWNQPLLNPIDAEIWLLVSMLIFVVVGRWFGAFEEAADLPADEAARA